MKRFIGYIFLLLVLFSGGNTWAQGEPIVVDTATAAEEAAVIGPVDTAAKCKSKKTAMVIACLRDMQIEREAEIGELKQGLADLTAELAGIRAEGLTRVEAEGIAKDAIRDALTPVKEDQRDLKRRTNTSLDTIDNNVKRLTLRDKQSFTFGVATGPVFGNTDGWVVYGKIGASELCLSSECGLTADAYGNVGIAASGEDLLLGGEFALEWQFIHWLKGRLVIWTVFDTGVKSRTPGIDLGLGPGLEMVFKGGLSVGVDALFVPVSILRTRQTSPGFAPQVSFVWRPS